MSTIVTTFSLYFHDNRVQVPQILSSLISIKSGDLMLGGGATSALFKLSPDLGRETSIRGEHLFRRHVNEYIKV